MKRLLGLAMTTSLLAQGVDTGMLLQRPMKNWPTFNGDYTGQRFSPLTQINTTNVGSLTLAWSFQTHQAAMKATPLVVDGVAYFSVPDHVWAADARTGRQIWHFSRNGKCERRLRRTGSSSRLRKFCKHNARIGSISSSSR